MSRQKWILGYDLCDDFSQISYYNTDKTEPDSVPYNGQMQIPTALCRLFADGRWLAGQEALNAAADGRGVLLRGFTSRMADDPLMDVAGERMNKSELMAIFVEETLKALNDLEENALEEAGEDFAGDLAGKIACLTVTTERVDLAMADSLKQMGRRLGLSPEQLALQSHRLSYEYYALSQRRELWTHDVGMFEYDSRGLRYHHLSVSWKHHPASVTAETVDLREYLDGSELADPVGPEMDRRLVEAIRKVSAGKTISTYYLVGAGFETGAGTGWMNVSLQQLCALKRHVFVGQNLYARGACYGSYYSGSLGRKPGFLAVNADLLMKDIYIRSVHRNTPQKLMLAQAGTPWYSVSQEKTLILNGGGQLVFHIRDTLTNFEQIAVMNLEELPERPEKTTKLQVQLSFRTDTCCLIRVTDMGFGEIFPGTGKVWEKELDINGENDSTEGLGREAVIEATTPAVTMPLDMKLSGMRIFTLEELCWYLAQNVYAITPELFDGKMFYWMDRITGDHSLALAIGNYQAAEKPLKEIVRLLLNSVDYLSNSEIARVYNQLTEMEHQNPVEQARLAADNYNRYGHPMAALKAYHHVVFQMEHDYESEVTRRFKAETWHNMGVAFLQLHHFSAAAECMSNAYELTRDKDDLEAWLHVLQLMGDQARILEITRQEGVPSEVTDGIMARYRQAEAAYADSERGKRMSAGLALKGEGQYEAYSQFVEEYLAEQKQRYSELR